MHTKAQATGMTDSYDSFKAAMAHCVNACWGRLQGTDQSPQRASPLWGRGQSYTYFDEKLVVGFSFFFFIIFTVLSVHHTSVRFRFYLRLHKSHLLPQMQGDLLQQAVVCIRDKSTCGVHWYHIPLLPPMPIVQNHCRSLTTAAESTSWTNMSLLTVYYLGFWITKKN